MGISQSRGREEKMDNETIKKVFKFPDGLKIDRDRTFTAGCLSTYSIIRIDDPRREIVQKKLFPEEGTQGFDNPAEDRAIGALLALAIGDSLGAPLEFSSVRYGSTELKGLEDTAIWKIDEYNRFQLKPGQWTDDASMGLCLAESLIANQGFQPLDLRLRFANWWTFGYCNAFGYDNRRGGKSSVGLGGNISQSFSEFMEKRTEYTTAGDKVTSGNGSLMRGSPVPIFYHDSLKDAEDYSYKQSKTTHQGDEAAECCRLLAHVIVKGIHGDGTKTFLGNLKETFKSDLYSVTCLSQSLAEEKHPENENLKIEDRNWNWKDENFRYSPSRSQQQPGYIGSYAMDGLAMALHCVWTTNSCKEAMLKCANIRGDADTVCAITGQIAGAIYGASAIPKEWIKILQQWDRNGDIALRAYLLFHKQRAENNQ